MTLKINLHGDYLADWRGVPAWAVGVAVDESGVIGSYAAKPTSLVDCGGCGFWYTGGPRWQPIQDYREQYRKDVRIANWQDTWRERPGQEEKGCA